MGAYEKLERLHDTMIEESSNVANDVMKRWLTTLSVGNGGALFGAATIAADDVGRTYLLIPSMWIFLIGVSAASLAFAWLGSAWRADEEGWRFSAANTTWENIGQPEKVDKTIVEHLERKADERRRLAASAAIAASVSFFLGVAIPLGQLSWSAARGSL